jgi:hypothetical protein
MIFCAYQRHQLSTSISETEGNKYEEREKKKLASGSL